jgi:Lon protease-like protein
MTGLIGAGRSAQNSASGSGFSCCIVFEGTVREANTVTAIRIPVLPGRQLQVFLQSIDCRAAEVSRSEFFPRHRLVFVDAVYTERVRLLAFVVALIMVSAGVALSAEAKASARQAATIPAEIPLFPLPETTLFPGVSRPLLIFEPRYREMIADALKGDKVIGMVRLRPGFEKDYEGRPPIYGVGCAGTIEKYEQLPDGRYVILLRGLMTFRIVSEDQRKPYRLARVEALPELLNDDERVTLSTVRNRIEKLLLTLLPLGVDPPEPSLDDAEFVNIIAQNFGMPEDLRQELLEHNSVLTRARALADRLEK